MNHHTGNKPLIISTYADQVITLAGGGSPPRQPGFVYGTVHDRRAYTWDELHFDQESLLRGFRLRGVEVMPAYAVGALRSFVEPVAYTLGLEEADAIAIGRALHHPYLIQCTESGMHLIDLRTGEPVADMPYRSAEPTGLCVMPNENPGEICFLRGGPYGSRAISAALDWKQERQRLIAALGCDTCQQGKHFRMRAHGAEGKVFTDGGAIPLIPHEVPTRYTVQLEATHA